MWTFQAGRATIGCMWLLLVAGCGGGGGGGASSTPTPSVPPTTGATPTSTSIPVLTATPPPPTATQPSAIPTLTPTLAPTTPTPSQVVEVATPTPTAVPPTATPIPTATSAPTATATPFTGPVISGVGLADSNGTFDDGVGTDAAGRRIFGRQSGSGFILFVEGRPGVSGLPVATNLLSTVRNAPIGRPDLQILVDRALGDGSPAVCDRSHPAVGGVPAIDPPVLDLTQPISDAMNDLACRFRVFAEPDFACTQDRNGNFQFSSVASTVQFCSLINDGFPFPAGDTIVTLRLRDTAGFLGPATQIVVRIRGN